MADKLVWVVYASTHPTPGVGGQFQYVLDVIPDDQMRAQLRKLLHEPSNGSRWHWCWADLHFYGPMRPDAREYIRRVLP